MVRPPKGGPLTLQRPCDQPEEWDFLTELGVNGIITITPAELLTWQATHRRLIARLCSSAVDPSPPEQDALVSLAQHGRKGYGKELVLRRECCAG